jgi:hypothetical protein
MSNRLFYSPQFFDVDQVDAPTDLTRKFLKSDNAAFLAAVAKELSTLTAPDTADVPGHAIDGEMAIGLIGSYGLTGYGLRRSQEIVRLDRGPSYWSHAFLFNGGLTNDEKLLRGETSPWLLECTLRPTSSLSDALYRDGVMPRRLAEYAPADFDWYRANSVPNMAVISVGLTQAERQEVRKAALAPQTARQRIGLAALAGQWFHYLNDEGELRNPLTLGQPVHSAAYVQLAYAAANVDLAPGAAQNTVAPEHFWGLAKYLQSLSLYRDPKTSTLKPRPIRIWTCIRDPYCQIVDHAVTLKHKEPDLADILKT